MRVDEAAMTLIAEQRDYLLGVLTRMAMNQTSPNENGEVAHEEAVRIRKDLLSQASRENWHLGHAGTLVGELRLYGRP